MLRTISNVHAGRIWPTGHRFPSRFYGVFDLRLRKHQVKHVLKARSGIQPMRFLPIKPKITLYCKSRPTPYATSLRREFSTSYRVKASTCSENQQPTNEI